MSRIGSVALNAFQDELEKDAAGIADLLTNVGKSLRGEAGHSLQAGLGAGVGLGALGGAAIGGVRGASQGYSDAKAEGAGFGGRVLRAAGAGVGSAARGAALGAGVGGLAGGAAGFARPAATTRATQALTGRNDLVGSAARFGQRQVHGFTGWRPGSTPHSLEAIRGGAYPARKGYERALLSEDPKQIARASKAFHSAEAAQEMGATSLPGLARAVTKDPVQALKTTARAQWDSSGPVEKALMVGFPAASVAAGVLGPEGGTDSAGQPVAGKGEKAMKAVGSLGYLAPLPIGASMAFGTVAERVGGGFGKLIDRVRRPGVPKEPSPPSAGNPNDSGQAAPAERVYGSGVTGQLEGAVA